MTGYGLDGQGIESRWGARFSALVQTGPGAHQASCRMNGYQVIPGRGIDHPRPSSVEVKERVELYIYSRAKKKKMPNAACKFIPWEARSRIFVSSVYLKITNSRFPHERGAPESSGPDCVSRSNRPKAGLGHCKKRNIEAG